MKLFGHEFGKKTEAPTPEATTDVAPATDVASVDVASIVAETPQPTPEVDNTAPIDTAAADLGAQADKLATMINDEVATTGSPDVAVPSADTGVPTVAEQAAAFDTTATTPSTEPSDTFAVPATPEAPEVPDVSSMESTEILNALDISPADATPVVEAPAEVTAELIAPATPEQNQQ